MVGSGGGGYGDVICLDYKQTGEEMTLFCLSKNLSIPKIKDGGHLGV